MLLALAFVFACNGVPGGHGSSSGGGGSSGGSSGSSSDPGGNGAAGDSKEDTPKKGPLMQPGKLSGPDAPIGITADQCTKLTDGGPLMAGSDSLTGVLKCGDKITGATKGGVKRFDSLFYEKKFCTPRTTNHAGGDERIYKFEEQRNQIAYITMDTPCANLDLAAIQSKDGKLPTMESSVDRCEMNIKKGTTRERVDLFARDPITWYVVVEGIDEEEGAFALTVDCFPWNE
jgi:hypothetical protein